MQGNDGINNGNDNEALMRQLVQLQQQVVAQQQRSLNDVSERRVNKYATTLFIISGILLLWFFGSFVSAFAISSRYGSGFLFHDHLLMPAAAVLLLLAGVQLMTKNPFAPKMLGIGLSVAMLWNIVAAINGYVQNVAGGSWYGGIDSGLALSMEVTRIVIYGLIIGGLALWFYKTKSIQDTVRSWSSQKAAVFVPQNFTGTPPAQPAAFSSLPPQPQPSQQPQPQSPSQPQNQSTPNPFPPNPTS